jgi:hypothetical protein
MTSFFLVQFIDKNDYYGIYSLREYQQSIFTIGITHYIYEKVYVKNIEPKPENEQELEGNDISRAIPGIDSHSIWLGMDIEPKKSWEDNIQLYHELYDWVRDSLFILRFLVNLNLKARIFFHVEDFSTINKDASISIHRDIELYCDSSSSFKVKYNKYNLVFPLLIKLLRYKPSDKMKAIMYNHASAKSGSSMIIDYFYSFATFEGIFHNWSNERGYSELWGNAIATQEEQDTIHKELRAQYEQYLKDHNYGGEKKKQLDSFKDSTFPSDRIIRRSLFQRFKSYYINRLSSELQENQEIQSLLRNFRQIAARRNEIGHSLEKYTQTSGLIEDASTLMSCIKLIMDFELKKFLKGEIDWKFESRNINLRDYVKPKTQDKVLDKFILSLEKHDIKNMILIDRKNRYLIDKIKFQSFFATKDERDESIEKELFQKKIFLELPESSRIALLEGTSKVGIIEIYKDPYWWIILTQNGSQYIIKSFETYNMTTHMHQGEMTTFCTIPTNRILSIARFKSILIDEKFALKI